MTPVEIVLLVVALIGVALASVAISKAFTPASTSLNTKDLIVPGTTTTGSLITDDNGITMKNSIPGYSPSLLNVYEEFLFRNVGFADNNGTPVTGTMDFRLTRIGKLVVMDVNTTNVNFVIRAAAGGTNIASTSTFPVRFQSTSPVVNPVLIGNNGVRSVSRCEISGGKITFWADVSLTATWIGNSTQPTFVNAATFCWTL